MSTTISHVPVLLIQSTRAFPVWKQLYCINNGVSSTQCVFSVTAVKGPVDVYFDLKINNKYLKNEFVKVLLSNGEECQTLVWEFPLYRKHSCSCWEQKNHCVVEVVASTDCESVKLSEVIFHFTIK